MYSQTYQDEFAYLLCNTDKGFFVDIGAGDSDFPPYGTNSNTKFLEEKGWSGILVECVYGWTEYAKITRSGAAVCARIPDTPIKKILYENNCPNTIDYLSIDIEPSSVIALETFPFDEYEFKILTFEHDLYAAGPTQKNKSHEILKSKGYICLCEDVETPMNAGPYEDWWINPKFFTENFIQNNIYNKKTGFYILNQIKQFIEQAQE